MARVCSLPVDSVESCNSCGICDTSVLPCQPPFRWPMVYFRLQTLRSWWLAYHNTNDVHSNRNSCWCKWISSEWKFNKSIKYEPFEWLIADTAFGHLKCFVQRNERIIWIVWIKVIVKVIAVGFGVTERGSIVRHFRFLMDFIQFPLNSFHFRFCLVIFIDFVNTTEAQSRWIVQRTSRCIAYYQFNGRKNWRLWMLRLQWRQLVRIAFCRFPAYKARQSIHRTQSTKNPREFSVLFNLKMHNRIDVLGRLSFGRI